MFSLHSTHTKITVFKKDSCSFFDTYKQTLPSTNDLSISPMDFLSLRHQPRHFEPPLDYPGNALQIALAAISDLVGGKISRRPREGRKEKVKKKENETKNVLFGLFALFCVCGVFLIKAKKSTGKITLNRQVYLFRKLITDRHVYQDLHTAHLFFCQS